jgi:uroporphyrinogen-III synthase
MGRILVLRSGGAELPPKASGPDVTFVTTHEIAPSPQGIAETLAFDARGARLVISSRVTVKVLLGGTNKGKDAIRRQGASNDAGARANSTGFFEKDFTEVIAVGEETASEVRRVQSLSKNSPDEWGASPPAVVVPPIPGAAGVLSLLRESPGGLSGRRILWPRGSDADTRPLEELSSLGASVVSPVVYEKRRRPLAGLSPEEGSVLSDFRRGGFGAVAAGSLAALEAFLGWLGNPAPAALPPVRWGVLGPETARAVAARGITNAAVPARARFVDLIDLLRKEISNTP